MSSRPPVSSRGKRNEREREKARKKNDKIQKRREGITKPAEDLHDFRQNFPLGEIKIDKTGKVSIPEAERRPPRRER